MERNESSSGAPRNIEGMKSRKECVIVIDTINIAKVRGEVKFRSFGDIEIRKTLIRFT